MAPLTGTEVGPPLVVCLLAEGQCDSEYSCSFVTSSVRTAFQKNDQIAVFADVLLRVETSDHEDHLPTSLQSVSSPRRVCFRNAV